MHLYRYRLDGTLVNQVTKGPWALVRSLFKIRSALDKWIKETRDLGEILEEELIRRGLVRDVLEEYKNR